MIQILWNHLYHSVTKQWIVLLRVGYLDSPPSCNVLMCNILSKSCLWKLCTYVCYNDTSTLPTHLSFQSRLYAGEVINISIVYVWDVSLRETRIDDDPVCVCYLKTSTSWWSSTASKIILWALYMKLSIINLIPFNLRKPLKESWILIKRFCISITHCKKTHVM